MKIKKILMFMIAMCIALPTPVFAKSKTEQDEYLGKVLINGDTSFDSDSIKNSDEFKWNWMSYPESRIVTHPQISRTDNPYKSHLNLKIGLFVKGLKGIDNFQTVKFQKDNGEENGIKNPSKTTWYPYQYQVSTELNEGKVDINEYFIDRNTLVRKFKTSETNGKVILSSDKQNGIFKKEENIVVHDASDYYLAYKVQILNADGSIKEAVVPTVEEDKWAAEINLSNHQEFVITMTLGVKNVKGESLENTVARANKATDGKNFLTLLGETKTFWDQKLAKVPAPTVWGIQELADKKGVTPELHKRSFYAAWTYQYQNIVEETPENGYNYKQVTLGKASMWNSGTPSAPNSCAWESFFDIQALAMVEPDIAWSAVEGFIQEIDENGILKGECLPSQKAHTVWVCHSYQPNVTKLRELYPKLKNYLKWRAENPRWIYGGHNYEDEKDLSFITQWFSDVDYAIKICKEIGMESDIAMWEQLKDDMYGKMREWFFSDPSGKLHWTYFTKTKEYHKYDRTEDVDNYIIGALSIDGLPQDMKDKLINYYVTLHDTSKDLVGFNFYKYGDGAYIAYGLLEEGLRNDKLKGMGKEFINAVLRNVVKSVEFSEESKPDDYQPSGVTPSTFTASAMIDYTYINNGVRIDQGIMSLFEAGDSEIDETSIPSLQTSILKAKKPILPRTIPVQTKDGQKVDAFVNWDSYDETLCNQKGEFIVKGKIAQTDLEASMKVLVYDGEVQYATIEKTIIANALPELPNKIGVIYQNNNVEYFDTAEIQWDDMEESQFVGGSTVKVKGHFIFNNQAVEATIHVLGKLNIHSENDLSHMARYDSLNLKVVDSQGVEIEGVKWSVKDSGYMPLADINTSGKLLAIRSGSVIVQADIPEYGAKLEKEIIVTERKVASLAYGADVIVTSNIDEARNGASAVDGDESTMWRAAKGDSEQTFTVKLKQVAQLDGISSLWFDETRPKKFKILVSEDGQEWEVAAIRSTTGNEKYAVRDVIAFDKTFKAQYIKIESTEKGGYEVGIQEFEAYGQVSNANTMTDMNIVSETGEFVIDIKSKTLKLSIESTTQNADQRVEWKIVGVDGKPTRLAEISDNGLITPLSNGEVEVIAKAFDGSGLIVKQKVTLKNQMLENVALNQKTSSGTNNGESYLAVDGDRTTRWGSSFGANQAQEFKVDFGKPLKVSSILIYCDSGAYPTDFKIQYYGSSGFTDIKEVRGNTSPNIRVDFDEIETIAVRIDSIATTNKEWGYSIWEFEAYGTTSKSLLRNLYDIYKNTDENLYKPKQWTAFKEAINQAKVVLDNVNATDDDIKAAETELQNTYQALELRSDMLALGDAIGKGQTVVDVLYTPTSVKTFNQAFKVANDVYADKNSSQAVVDKASEDLNQAIQNLIKQADMSDLEEQLKKAEEIDSDYTPATLQIFKKAFLEAQKIYENRDSSQKEVDQATETLKQAINQLTKLANKKALQEIIEKAEAVKASEYTKVSYTALQDSLKQAKEINDNQNATQQMVDEGYVQLQTAYQCLVKITLVDQVLKNQDETVIVSGQFPENIQLVVEMLKDKEFNTLKDSLSKNTPEFFKKAQLEYVYDICLMLNDEIYHLDHEIKLIFKLDEKLNGKKIGIIYIDDKGKIQTIDSIVDNGYIQFTTNQLSKYAIVTYQEDNQNVSKPGQVVVPQTGDKTSYIIWSSLIFVSIAGLYMTMKKRKEN